MILNNVLYRSNEQTHVRFYGSERKEEHYYLYYTFRPDGIWICKTTDVERMDLEDFMGGVDLAEITFDPDHTEPMDDKQELLYQCGKYEIRENTVYCTWKNKHLEEKEGRMWYFRIRSEYLLSTDFEEVELKART